MVAHYAFENNTEDSSGNGLHGTIVGNPIFVEGPASFGTAMDFDGVGDYIDCGSDPAFDIADEIAVAAWANIISIPTQWVAIVSKGENAWRISNVGSSNAFHFGINIWSSAYPSVNGNTAVGTDEWHHVCGTYDGSSINIYLDGAIDGTLTNATTGIGTSTTNLFIGENPEETGRYWDGLIDEVTIYNRALSRAEILYLMGER